MTASSPDAKTASGNDTLVIGNTGNVPILSYTITNDFDPSFSQTVENVNIKPGETSTLDVADLKYPVDATTTVNWKVTANGVSATDPTIVSVPDPYKIAGSMKNQVKGEDGKWYDADTAKAAAIFSKEGTAETQLVITNPTSEDYTVASYVDNTGKTITDGKTVVKAGGSVTLPGGTVQVKRGDAVVFTAKAQVVYGSQKLDLTNPVAVKANVASLTFKAPVDGKDANTTADADQLTAKDQNSTAKDQNSTATGKVTGEITNTGDVDLVDPVVKGDDGSEITLTGVTIKVGETQTVTIDDAKAFKVGDTAINYTVTANGVSATDPINTHVTFPWTDMTPAYTLDVQISNQVKDSDGNWQDANDQQNPVSFVGDSEHDTQIVITNPTKEAITVDHYVDNNGKEVKLDTPLTIEPGQSATVDGGTVTVKAGDPVTLEATVTATHGDLSKDATDPINVVATTPAPTPEPSETSSEQPTQEPTSDPTDETVVVPTAPAATTPAPPQSSEPVQEKTLAPAPIQGADVNNTAAKAFTKADGSINWLAVGATGAGSLVFLAALAMVVPGSRRYILGKLGK